MLAREPYSGPRKLVLAFDIGTTYSGVSYCILQPGQIPEIRGAEGRGNAKVPSILYYDASGNVKVVGEDALSMNTINDAEENGWTKAEWWKLHLRPKHLASAHIKDEDIPSLPPGKSAVDILTDFIKYLFTAAKTHIEEHYMGFNWISIENSIEFVFSHPNGWEGLQQQKYREAIQGAGLIPGPEEQTRVCMITEGEASLHYCVSSLLEDSTDTEPQAIIVIDAGGGTIDLSAFSVTFDPVACEEIAPAECRLQGSVFVTRRAVNLLQRKLEGLPESNTEEMDDLAQEFDRSTKLSIRNAEEPVYLTMVNRGLRYHNPQFNVKRGALKLSGEEATSLFNESIKAIIDAFDEQCKAANKRNRKVTGLLTCFRNKAVANGAVISHIDRAVKSRVARATYGVPYTPWLDQSDPEHLRRKNKWRKCASGQYAVDGGFCPILRKGDQVDEEDEIRHTFCYMNRNKWDFGGERMEILCYRGNSSNPQWIDEDPCKLVLASPNNSVAQIGISGEGYHQVEIDVVAYFGSTELTAQMAWKENGIEKR
ncbi:hypothetical protein HD554DRAFT_2174667 [Boletus coccyginus]|nr:hypothetical protein HD554DRAFT_2174667 [Boletus coccyginus]